jgi:hypothetical protein
MDGETSRALRCRLTEIEGLCLCGGGKGKVLQSVDPNFEEILFFHDGISGHVPGMWCLANKKEGAERSTPSCLVRSSLPVLSWR